MTNRAIATFLIGLLLMTPMTIAEENESAEPTPSEGEICYNTATHTISAGASYAECMAYA